MVNGGFRESGIGDDVWRTAVRLAWPAVLAAWLVLLPFWNKAYTIDDPMVLMQAQQYLDDPLHPAARVASWELARTERLGQFMPNGPVMGLLMTPVVWLGAPEPLAHLLQWSLLTAAIIGTVALGLRLEAGPTAARWAGLLLAGTPTVLAMAGSNMSDIAACAFAVIGMERLIAAASTQPQAWLAGGTFLGLAAMARLHTGLLPGLLGLWLMAGWVWERRPVPVRVIAALGVTAGLVAAGTFWSGRGLPEATPIATATQYSTLAGRSLAENGIAYLVHWVLTTPLVLGWTVLQRGPRWRSAAPALLLAGGAVTLFLEIRKVPFLLLVGATVLVLLCLLGDSVRARDRRGLLCSLWLLLPVPLMVYAHLPSKYLIACMPAAGLLLGLLATGAAWRRSVLAGLVLGGMLLGLLILRADAVYANLTRQVVREWIGPAVRDGRRVWFAGHWGLLWYGERAGARRLLLDSPPPQPGDLLVVSTRDLARPVPLPTRRKLLQHWEEREPGGRIMDQTLRAGFYTNGLGLLPWAWGDTVVNRFELWEIQ